MNTKITFLELSELIAEATSTSNRMCELFLRELFNTISQALIDGESVKIKGIGTFKVTQVKPRKSANVNTGAPIEIAGYKKLTFTPDKSLAEVINQPFAQFETVMLSDDMTDEKLAEIDKQYPSVAADNDQPDAATLDDQELNQPDMPMAPLPDDLPQMQEAAPVPEADGLLDPIADISPAEPAKPEPKPVKPEPVKPEPVKPEPKPVEPKPVEPKPVEPKPVESKPVEPKPVEPEPKPVEPVKRKPMLVGIPIDGPSQPVPQEEKPEEVIPDRRFYRPEPRNVYTPTPEQIEEASRKPDRRWLWALLGVIATALVFWGILKGCGSGITEPEEHIAVQADTLVDLEDDGADKADVQAKEEPKAKEDNKATETKKVEEKKVEEKKPEPKAEEKKAEPESKAKPDGNSDAAKGGKEVTDVVTSQIVLSTLAEKHYGSPWFWVYIYQENKNRGIISDPNNIRPGTRVVIPPAKKYGINPNDKASLKKAQRLSWEILNGN